GGACSRRSSASRPLLAVSTAYPSHSRMSAIVVRIAGSSSTTRMRGRTGAGLGASWTATRRLGRSLMSSARVPRLLRTAALPRPPLLTFGVIKRFDGFDGFYSRGERKLLCPDRWQKDLGNRRSQAWRRESPRREVGQPCGHRATVAIGILRGYGHNRLPRVVAIDEVHVAQRPVPPVHLVASQGDCHLNRDAR